MSRQRAFQLRCETGLDIRPPYDGLPENVNDCFTLDAMNAQNAALIAEKILPNFGVKAVSTIVTGDTFVDTQLVFMLAHQFGDKPNELDKKLGEASTKIRELLNLKKVA